MTAYTEVQFIQFSFQYSSLALIYYDYFLTFRREVTYVWKRPFHILTVLYFFCRYSLISNVIYALGLYEKFVGTSCDTAYIISASFGVLGRIGILAIIGTRTCAIYQYNRPVVILFALMGTFVAAAAVAHVPTVSCTGAIVARNPKARIPTDLLSSSTVVFELLSTLFVVAGCIRNLKSTGGYTIQKKGLLGLMLREGVAYTAFVTTLTTTALILNYAAPLGSFFQRLLNAYTIPISGIVTARFLLHVREWQGGSGGQPSQISFDLNSPGALEDNQAYRGFSERAHINANQSFPFESRRGSDDSNMSNTSADTIETFGGHTEFVVGDSYLRPVAAMDHPSFKWSHTASEGHGWQDDRSEFSQTGRSDENSVRCQAVSTLIPRASGQEMEMKSMMGITTRITEWDYRSNQGASSSAMV